MQRTELALAGRQAEQCHLEFVPLVFDAHIVTAVGN